MARHYLTNKLSNYLLRLEREYENNNNSLQRDIIRNCRSILIEATDYDDLSEAVGHDARLYIPLDVHCKVPLSRLDRVCEGIRDDLNRLARQVRKEYFCAVIIEVDDENDPEYQRAIPFLSRPPLNPDTVSFWKPGQVRLFISHRDNHKIKANELSDALSPYGISSFLAHDTIKPLREWRHEILRGLETMEMMLVYLTDDFEDSYWTQQEVGYALGKGIPIISLKLQKKDPSGFIGNVQAQRGQFDGPAASASAIYKLISEELGAKDRLNDGLVAAFVSSEDYNQARYRFDRMETNVDNLTDNNLSNIMTGYRDNKALSSAYYLNNEHDRLIKYLNRATGQRYQITGNEIHQQEVDLDNDVPF